MSYLAREAPAVRLGDGSKLFLEVDIDSQRDFGHFGLFDCVHSADMVP